MVDAVDSKSTEGNLLRVRVSPPVPGIARVREWNDSRALFHVTSEVTFFQFFDVDHI